MTSQIRGTGFGFSDQARIDRALGQVIQAMNQEKCNCLEITGTTRKAFLGIQYTRVDARARHIQPSRSFHPLSSGSAPTHSANFPDARSPVLAKDAIQSWENEGGVRDRGGCPSTQQRMIMNKELTKKRLAKRHNRHSGDEVPRTRLSLPDVRTHEQTKAAREASRPNAAGRQSLKAHAAVPSTRNLARPASGSAAKADA
jgi:hypothetical protein